MARESKRGPGRYDRLRPSSPKRQKIQENMASQRESGWSLHPQLAADTIALGDLPLCRVLIINDANYPWLLLVPRVAGAGEVIDLDDVEAAQMTTEIGRVGRALKEVTGCDKLNVAALGNVVPQLHIHLIARRKSDAAWPKPVWGHVPALSHDRAELERFMAALRARIWID